jgi:hypothetical protein
MSALRRKDGPCVSRSKWLQLYPNPRPLSTVYGSTSTERVLILRS